MGYPLDYILFGSDTGYRGASVYGGIPLSIFFLGLHRYFLSYTVQCLVPCISMAYNTHVCAKVFNYSSLW